jgi:hypothetical protein
MDDWKAEYRAQSIECGVEGDNVIIEHENRSAGNVEASRIELTDQQEESDISAYDL